ncbi:MAG: iron-sulfur cluster assembly accessory protein [Alphaproteobacteria bacterium]
MTKRERPKIVQLTDAAASRVKAILAGRPEGAAALRVGVKNGGCAGQEYTMDYVREAGPFDETVEDKGVKILIDAKAIMFLLGTEIDFTSEKLKAGFVFRNPNQTDACGCGESVMIVPAKEDA